MAGIPTPREAVANHTDWIKRHYLLEAFVGTSSLVWSFLYVMRLSVQQVKGEDAKAIYNFDDYEAFPDSIPS